MSVVPIAVTLRPSERRGRVARGSSWLAAGPINRFDRCAIAGFVLLVCAVGALVEYRSAFLTRRMGDLDVFLRAAWAVRNGEDLYQVTSNNGWHYIYPPLYAILLTPLADPPRGAAAEGYLAYPVSVALCFAFNVLCVLLGVDVLARTLERGTGEMPFCRRWLWLRLLPVLVCCLPIGHTLMRGQANALVLAVLCAALASWMRGRNFRAGLWLALAICIKVIPVYLLVYPLWKRDGRALLGCLVGCILGLVLIPLVVFGPVRTVTHYETYGRVFFAPFLKLNDDASRKEEIVGHVNATDSVGVRNAIHSWMYPDPDRRPEELDLLGKSAYLFLGLAMTLLTLWPGRGGLPHARPENPPTTMACQFASLVVLMAVFSPVCHSHYLLFCLPAVMVLCARAWQHQATLCVPWALTAMFITFFATLGLAYLPGLEVLKDRCVALFATLPWWAIPLADIRRRPMRS